MTMCTCLVQAGQVPAMQRATLQQKLDQLTRSAFGTAADIRWIEVASGSGFTAGKPSTSSFVSVVAPAPLDQSVRSALLHELSGLWSAHTGCSPDELMAVLSDPRPS